VVLRYIMRPDGRIGGFGVNPLSQVPAIDSGGTVIKPL
jgi:hypothetical protein